jgi:hypothetical protein
MLILGKEVDNGTVVLRGTYTVPQSWLKTVISVFFGFLDNGNIIH